MHGGNILKSINTNETQILHDELYHYSLVHDAKSANQLTSPLKSFILFFLDNDNIVELKNKTFDIPQSNFVFCSSFSDFKIVKMGRALLSGSKQDSPGTFCKMMTLEQAKVVKKPWGREYWLSGEDHIFSFKHILLNQGFQTSLQYHNHKIETNLIFSGQADFIFNSNEHKFPQEESQVDIEQVKIETPTSIHINNGIVHRIKALSDLSLFEVSTPELDDVIRLSDDSSRISGRIEDEHK